jgi:hypothetical protein
MTLSGCGVNAAGCSVVFTVQSRAVKLAKVFDVGALLPAGVGGNPQPGPQKSAPSLVAPPGGPAGQRAVSKGRSWGLW